MKFYWLLTDEGKKRKYAWAYPIDGLPSETIECTVCKRTWQNSQKSRELNRPFPIVLTNNVFPDFMSCQGESLISQRALDFLEKQGLDVSKLHKMPIVGCSELTKEQKRSLREDGVNVKKLHDEKPTYYRLTAEKGACLHSDSNVVWVDSGEKVCKACGFGVGYKQKNWDDPIYIQKNTWNGRALFKVKEFSGPVFFCSEQFKNGWEEEGLTGLLFEEVIVK